MRLFILSSVSFFLSSSVAAWLIAAATGEPATTGSTSCLKILLTNDDGYDTLFIQSMFKVLRDETCHNVTMVAPKIGQSGKGASVALLQPLELGNPEEGVHFVDSTPVNAVLFGIDAVFPELGSVPDLVISGPNEGNNLGYVTMVSGTVGAAAAALARGIPAIAVSASEDDDDDPEAATLVGRLVARLVDTKVFGADGSAVLGEGEGLNVNIPSVSGGALDDYEFKLTKVGLAPGVGGFKFYRDLADSWVARYVGGGGLDGYAGLSVEIPYTAAGYPLDEDPNSERNAMGDINGDDPTFVIAVSPISFSYGTSASQNLERAFQGTLSPLVNVGTKRKNACEGDCDNDKECKGDLVCFTREGLEEVPGCSGQGETGDDYCTVRPSDSYLIYKGNGKTNLGLCEGDCDADSDCATGFVCFERVEFNPVPGCEGKGARSKDYCIPPELA